MIPPDKCCAQCQAHDHCVMRDGCCIECEFYVSTGACGYSPTEKERRLKDQALFLRRI